MIWLTQIQIIPEIHRMGINDASDIQIDSLPKKNQTHNITFSHYFHYFHYFLYRYLFKSHHHYIINLTSTPTPQMTTTTTPPQSTKKKQAFKSYIEGNSSAKKPSDQEQPYEEEFTQQNTNCNVCGCEVLDAVSKKKKCGFCQQIACNEHLRKRRAKKKKQQRICDNCQDKYLYDYHMKLQIKAQQSLSAQQQIIQMKRNDLYQILQSKQTKRRQLSFDQQQILKNYQDEGARIDNQNQKLGMLEQKLGMLESTCGQIQEYNMRMGIKIRSNFQEDHRILSLENEKLGDQLSVIEKRCFQVRLAIEKREKQLQEAYQSWERKQFGKPDDTQPPISPSSIQKCIIF